MASSFTYNIQQAGYDFDQYDFKGEASYEIFLDAFQTFPWKNQVGKNSGKSEPTISVINTKRNIDLWVSVIGKSDDHSYLIGIVRTKMVRSMFGFGKEKEVRWVTVYIAEQQEAVLNTFKVFFENDNERLDKLLSVLPQFLDQEAR